MDRGPDGKAFKRLNAIHLLFLGVSFSHVLRNSRVSERTLRLWVSRFNSMGIDGLVYRPRLGRPRKMEAARVTSDILSVVDDPSLAGQTHWTLTKLHGWLLEEKQIELSYRTLVRYLHESNYARRIPRKVPEPPDRDAWIIQREEFIPKLLALLEEPQTRVFFGDEAGFEGDPRPRAKWVKRGSRPTQGYYGGHIRQNVVGAVDPAGGELVSLIVPHCDTEVFQAFLDTMAQEVPRQERKRVVLVLDNAGWHKAKSLAWHHIEPVYLPPYSPDLNPIERLWQHLKGQYLAGYFTRSGQELGDKIYNSIRDLLGMPDVIRSVCRTHTP